MRFCPKCGKKGIKGKFCSECYEEEMGLDFRDIEALKCIECDRMFVKNAWKEFAELDKGLIETAELKIRNPKRLKLEIIPVYDKLVMKNKPGAQDDIEFEVRVEDEKFVIPAVLKYTICPKCSKRGTQYFEGILQLRNVTPELEKFVLDEFAAAEKDGVHITKSTKKGKSWDLKVTSKKFMRVLGKKLKNKFVGELSESPQLFTRDKQRSKDVYRLNVLFKQMKYQLGDIVTDSRGRKIKITTLGKKVSGVDQETGKKVFVN